MHFAKCAALAAALFTTLTQNLKLCTSAEAGLFLIWTPLKLIWNKEHNRLGLENATKLLTPWGLSIQHGLMLAYFMH